MKFSICIPNYNYEKYLGLTIESVLAQTFADYELVIADNCSTDKSVDIIKSYRDKNQNIKYNVNLLNVGFAGNLDRAAIMASYEHIIMLSSDDIIKPHALSMYDKLLNSLPNRNIAISSTMDMIDANGKKIGIVAPDPEIWKSEDLNDLLTEKFGYPVYRIEAVELLTRCVKANKTPFNFCTTCYPKTAYEKTGGYGQSRMINPDKWFHWRLLMELEEAFFIDSPLFQYRWHDNNQTAQQKNSGHLKYVVDEYRGTIEIGNEMLNKVCLKREDYNKIFINKVIIRHGLGELSKWLWLKSFRILCFGWTSYPKLMLGNFFKSTLFGILLLSGPIGIVCLQGIKLIQWKKEK